MEKAVYVRTVKHAVDLAGGHEALARRLGVGEQDVLRWSLGESRPDTMAFLFVLDFIMEETRKLSRDMMAFGLAEQIVAKAQSSSKAIPNGRPY